MVHMTATVSSPKIGIGPKKLGFKCGCVISGHVTANAFSRHALGTADEAACNAAVSVKPKPNSDNRGSTQTKGPESRIFGWEL